MSGIGGSWAEKAFEQYAHEHGIAFERYGFDQSKLPNFYALPEFVRLTPDYVCTQKRNGFLVECKGTGTGPNVSFKVRDMYALKAWSELATLLIFVNDSALGRVSLTPYDDIFNNVSEFTRGTWDDGVEFFKIPKSFFVWEDK